MSKLDKIKEVISKMRAEENRVYNVLIAGKWAKEDKFENHNTRKKLADELLKLGLEFQCTDYGEAYCLDINGLEAVLKAIEE